MIAIIQNPTINNPYPIIFILVALIYKFFNTLHQNMLMETAYDKNVRITKFLLNRSSAGVIGLRM